MCERDLDLEEDVGKVIADSNGDRVERVTDRSPINNTLNTIAVHNNDWSPIKVDKDLSIGLAIVDHIRERTDLERLQLLGDVDLKRDRDGAGARDREVDIVGLEVPKRHVGRSGCHAGALDLVLVSVHVGVDHLVRVSVVGRLEGSGDGGDFCGGDLDRPVLVGDLRHGGALEELGDGDSRADGSQATVEGGVGRGACKSGKRHDLVGAGKGVRELLGGGEGHVKGGVRDDLVITGDELEALDGRGTDMGAVVGSIEADITKSQGQLRWVVDADNGSEVDVSINGRVDLDRIDILDVLKIVKTLEGDDGVEADAGDGQMTKDTEVQLGVNGALEGDGVRGLGGEGADKAGEGSLRVGEDIEG